MSEAYPGTSIPVTEISASLQARNKMIQDMVAAGRSPLSQQSMGGAGGGGTVVMCAGGAGGVIVNYPLVVDFGLSAATYTNGGGTLVSVDECVPENCSWCGSSLTVSNENCKNCGGPNKSPRN